MGHPYFIVIAPTANVQIMGGGFPGDRHTLPIDTVEKTLGTCSFQKSEGRTLWGEHLEEFLLPDGDLNSLCFEAPA